MGKWFFTSVILASTVLIGCQPASTTPSQQKAFYALSVDDMDTMVDWYASMLDVKIIAQGERPAPNGKAALLGNESFLIELQDRMDSKAVHSVTGDIRDTHLAYGVFKIGITVNDLDAKEAEFKQKDANFAHGIVDTHPDLSLRTFTIVDAEGNMIQFFGR